MDTLYVGILALVFWGMAMSLKPPEMTYEKVFALMLFVSGTVLILLGL